MLAALLRETARAVSYLTPDSRSMSGALPTQRTAAVFPHAHVSFKIDSKNNTYARAYGGAGCMPICQGLASTWWRSRALSVSHIFLSTQHNSKNVAW
jgi:hypothetical protein